MGAEDLYGLSKGISSLIRTIEAQTEELREFVAPVRAIPKHLETQTKVMEELFSQQLQGMAEIQMTAVRADQGVFAGMLRTLQTAAAEVVDVYADEVAQVARRYDKIQSDLNADALARVRALDGPALELMSVDFEQGVLRYYREQFVPRAELLSAAVADACQMREAKLAEDARAVADAMDALLALRRHFWERVESILYGEGLTGPEVRCLPLYFVDVEGAGGARRTEYYLDTRASPASGKAPSRAALDAARCPAALARYWERLTERALGQPGSHADRLAAEARGEPVTDAFAAAVLREAKEALGKLPNGAAYQELMMDAPPAVVGRSR